MKNNQITITLEDRAKKNWRKKQYSAFAIAAIYLLAVLTFLGVFIFGIKTNTSMNFYTALSNYGSYFVILAIGLMLYERASKKINWPRFWRKIGILLAGILLYNFAFLIAKLIYTAFGFTR